MYCKKYSIDDINFKDICIILRFSKNKFVDERNILTGTGIDIPDLLRKLKEIAHSDNRCYNNIHPWDDIDVDVDSLHNKEIIIVYNFITGHIQSWCNISYSKIDSGDKCLYTSFIDKIVVKDKPKIKRIGSLVVDFIRKECFLKPIIYKYYDHKELALKMDILYLYSLTSSIKFYDSNKNVLKYPFHCTAFSQDEESKLNHVFIIFSKDLLESEKKFFIFMKSNTWDNFTVLHTFEVNSQMDEDSIRLYNSFISPEDCNNNNDIISALLKDDINIYKPYLLYSNRKMAIQSRLSIQRAIRTTGAIIAKRATTRATRALSAVRPTIDTTRALSAVRPTRPTRTTRTTRDN
jgi:hypothetical protein